MMNIEFNTMLSENERLVEIPAVCRNCTPAGKHQPLRFFRAD